MAACPVCPGEKCQPESAPQRSAADAPAPALYTLSYLLHQVATLAELPTDAPVYRRLSDRPVLEPFDPATVRHPQLLAAIEQGRIYAVWGQHLAPIPSTDNWASHCRKP